MMNKLLTWVLCCGAIPLFSQTYVMNGIPVSACSGVFYDSGGAAGDYGNNQNLSTVICPDGMGSNTHVQLLFDQLNLAPGDQLCLYDGANVLAPLIACYSTPLPALPFSVKASPANASACLTLSFVSDANGVGTGWQAAIACYSPCPLPAPTQPIVTAMTNGNMVWTWDPVPGSIGYEISLNGGPFQPANGGAGHTVSGLVAGNLVVLEIRAISGSVACPAASITANQTYVDCALEGGLDGKSNVTCRGLADGSAILVSIGGFGPLQYFVDDNPTPVYSSDFLHQFAAGTHQIVLQDTAGCRDTLSFFIDEPPGIQINIEVTDALCQGGNTGEVNAVASGGTPPFSYVWQACQGGPFMPGTPVTGLFAGCYAVTVTDDNGCTAVAQDSIREPLFFEFVAFQDSVRCFGGSDGQATVLVSSATPPYTYAWDNGDTTATADSLTDGFHSVSITDAKGCEAVTLVEVLEPPKLTIDSLAVVPVSCFAGNNGAATVWVSPGSGVAPYDYQWNPTNVNQPSISGLAAGPYSVTVVDAHGCTTSLSALVPSPPALVTQMTGVLPESCAGACDGSLSLQISGGKPNYTINWSPASIPPGTLLLQNLCPGVYRATVTDANGCTQTSSASILAATPLTVQLNAVFPNCIGDQNGSLSATPLGGTPGYQYAWSTGGSGNAIQNLSCGVYRLTLTDAKGCSLVRSDTLPCPIPLVLDSIVAKPVRCFGETNGTISVAVHGGNGALSYAWSDPNQQFDPVAVNLPKGVYTVTVTDSNGCTLSASATVTEPPPLQVSVSVSPIKCFGGSTGSAQAVVSGGAPGYTYQWSVPQDSSTITGLTAGTYSLTVVDSYGCPFSTLPFSIAQPATPVQVAASQTRTACFGGGNGEAFATASGSNGNPYSFSWSNGLSGPNPSGFSAGTVTVTATDPMGCTGTQTLVIQQWAEIQIGILQIAPTCRGGSDGQAGVNLVSGGAGGGNFANYQYTWSIPGIGDTIYVDGLPSNQTFTVTVTDADGCSGVKDFVLADQMPITAQLNTDSVSCFGLSDGAISIDAIQSKFPVVQFVWSNQDSTRNISGLASGIYTVTLTDNKGCSATASISVWEPASVSIQLDLKTLVCNIDSNGMINTLVQGGTPGYTYLWSTGDTGSLLADLGPGQYTVTVSDRNLCTAEATAQLAQPNSPNIDVRVTPPTCFNGQDGLCQLVVSGGAPPYQFSLDGQSYNGSGVFLGLRAGQYTAYVRDANACLTGVAFSVDQPLPVLVTLPPDTTLVLGDSLLLSSQIANTIGPTVYFWEGYLVDSLRCADEPECTAIWVFPLYDNTYELTVVDSNGCQGQATVRVQVEKPRGAYVPTGFSPNADGNNDRLVVFGKSRQIRQVNVFRVYDRWGELVYEDRDFTVNDESRGWDGQFRGQECPPGVYVWYLEVEYLDGFGQSVNGHTTLIR
ncbi:MAG: gliding motility-associated C-terminal domain-containing protein [Saprospiraceae bacterium]|nr:gliding motility-associated C-terminal domain-containing protein [Saprospiraceae bacterium]